MFKKDLIEITRMKGRHKIRKMRIDPYPDALLRRGLRKKEPQETAEPILEEAMMYLAAVGMEMMEEIVIVHDAVDRSTLEASERKAEVDRSLVQLWHQLRRRDHWIAIIDEWKGEVTEHMRDIGEAQGLVRGRLSEAEYHLDQLQALAAAQHWEIDLLGGVVIRQLEVINIQRWLLLELEVDFNWKLGQLERMLSLEGRTFGNPIVIKDDPVEDVVTLVGHEA